MRILKSEKYSLRRRQKNYLNIGEMYLAIKDAEPMDNYLLLLTFENGKKRHFDMKPYLHLGIFQELKDIDLFKTVRTSFDTIEWNNEADLDPEILYLESTEVK